MFTPTNLIKQFIKEAFSKEQVPASDQRIKTWETHRKDIARNVLGILQTPTSVGKFILKNQFNLLKPEVEVNPVDWFYSFNEFHRVRILDQLWLGDSKLDKDFLEPDEKTLISKISA